jgi:hypothetical protein
MSNQEEKGLTRWEWGIECYVKDRRGSMYLADEADQALAEKDAHIDHLNAVLAAQVNLTNALRDTLHEALERAEDGEDIPESWIKDWRAILSKV